MPHFLSVYPFGPDHISFRYHCCQFFKYKDKIILAVCTWKKPWHTDPPETREKLLAISRPVVDWLRFFLPWPFLINGRICSVVEKPLSWAQSLLASERDQLHSWSHCQVSASDSILSVSNVVDRERGGSKSIPINVDIWTDNKDTSNQKPFPHLGHCIPFRSRLFSSM